MRLLSYVIIFDRPTGNIYTLPVPNIHVIQNCVLFNSCNRYLMYKTINICTVIFFSFIFGHSAYAMDGACGLNTCEPRMLFSELSTLGLKPTIKKNGDLVANLQIEFGESFVKELIEKHPSLALPNGKVDGKTIKWVREFGFSNTFSPGVKYVFSPFLTSENDFGAQVFIETLIPETYPILRSRAGFFSVEQLNEIKEMFSEHNYAFPVYILEKSLGFNHGAALKVSKRIYKEIFNESNYIIAGDIKKISNHNITIVGHGDPGNEYIVDGDVMIHFKDVVKILKDNGIPNSVNVELKHCFSGIGTEDEMTDKTESELKELFINKRINELVGDHKNSYAYKFSNEIYNYWPEFKGNVFGYKGFINLNQGFSYMRNPKDPTKVIMKFIYSVALGTVDNEMIDFDRTEMMVEYKRNDFIKTSS